MPTARRPATRVHHPYPGAVNTKRRRQLLEVARALPRSTGIYLFYGYRDRLLYIGKAQCLRERVSSYFAETAHRRSGKLRRLLAEVTRLETRACGSDLEALLTERRAIAELRPLLNWQHKRFDVYPYLLLTEEEFPRLTLTRAEPFQDFHQSAGQRLPLETPPRPGEVPGLYLGPFTTPRLACDTLEAVRTLFPLRTCEGRLTPDAEGAACFYHDIGRCAAPCIREISQPRYGDLCGELVQWLESGDSPRAELVRQRMHRLAAEMRFEEAGRLKHYLQVMALASARLRRLRRMQARNNVVVVQPALQPGCVNLFLVQGGVVRRFLHWSDVAALESALLEVYVTPAGADFTSKAELDDMMLLDRWLRHHGEGDNCVWVRSPLDTAYSAAVERRILAVLSR